MRRTKLIVFEGPDGIGKSQLSNDICEWLNQRGISTIRLSFPGNSANTLGQLVYDVHHRHVEQFRIPTINPLSLQILHIAAHIDEIDRAIRPAMEADKWIVLDRFWWSTWVYGMAAGVNAKCLDLVIEAERLYWGDIVPAAIFLVKRSTPVRREQSQEQFNNLSRLYEQLAERERESFAVYEIENRELAESQNQITSILDKLIEA
jgi:dTMP kinase